MLMDKYYPLILISIIAIVISVYSCKNSSGGSTGIKQSTEISSEYEIKKKELELKEKELDLKEKEMKLNSKLKKITPEEVKVFIENWASIQTDKRIDEYISLYSTEFRGVKKSKSGKTSYFNYDEWINDRRKLYVSAKNLYLGAYNIRIISFDPNSGNTKVQFTQYYSSNDYQDEGLKVLELLRDDSGNIKIIREEMIYSSEVVDGC